MKKTIMAIAILLAAGTTSFAQAKQDTTHKHQHNSTSAAKKYTCTMHPEVVRTKPGKCPKCGMGLVPMKMKGKKTVKPMGDMKM